MYSVFTKQDLHATNAPRDTASTICQMCNGLIGQMLTTSKGNRYTLTFIFLLTSYLITISLKMKTIDKVSMVYIKEILPKTSCNKFILQDNGTEFENEQFMTVFDNLGIKKIYSNPYYPRGNGRIKNMHNFLKQTITIFMHGRQLK